MTEGCGTSISTSEITISVPLILMAQSYTLNRSPIWNFTTKLFLSSLFCQKLLVSQHRIFAMLDNWLATPFSMFFFPENFATQLTLFPQFGIFQLFETWYRLVFSCWSSTSFITKRHNVLIYFGSPFRIKLLGATLEIAHLRQQGHLSWSPFLLGK